MKYLDKLTDEDLKELCTEILELWDIDRSLTDFKVDRKLSDITYEMQGDVWDIWEGKENSLKITSIIISTIFLLTSEILTI